MLNSSQFLIFAVHEERIITKSRVVLFLRWSLEMGWPRFIVLTFCLGRQKQSLKYIENDKGNIFIVQNNESPCISYYIVLEICFLEIQW